MAAIGGFAVGLQLARHGLIVEVPDRTLSRPNSSPKAAIGGSHAMFMSERPEPQQPLVTACMGGDAHLEPPGVDSARLKTGL
jgi:hypothetical protein